MVSKLAKLLSPSSVQQDMSDEDLMLEARAGNQESFGILYNRYKGPILNYVLGMVKIQGVAEEITHEVFLKLYRNRETYEVRAKFTTWLWTLAKNTSIDYLRKKKELLYEDFSATNDEGDSKSFEVVDQSSTAEELIIDQIEQKDLRDCVEALPGKQKEAMNLRIFSELSYDEIAEVMQTSMSAVKSLIKRGKDSLVACMQSKQEGDNGE